MIRRWRRSRGALGCHEVGRRLQVYLDGEIDEERARLVAAHLEECLRCGMEAETYSAIKRCLQRLSGPEAPEALERLRVFGERLAEVGAPETGLGDTDSR